MTLRVINTCGRGGGWGDPVCLRVCVCVCLCVCVWGGAARRGAVLALAAAPHAAPHDSNTAVQQCCQTATQQCSLAAHSAQTQPHGAAVRCGRTAHAPRATAAPAAHPCAVASCRSVARLASQFPGRTQPSSSVMQLPPSASAGQQPWPGSACTGQTARQHVMRALAGEGASGAAANSACTQHIRARGDAWRQPQPWHVALCGRGHVGPHVLHAMRAVQTRACVFDARARRTRQQLPQHAVLVAHKLPAALLRQPPQHCVRQQPHSNRGKKHWTNTKLHRLFVFVCAHTHVCV
jgi:hypothetical protein